MKIELQEYLLRKSRLLYFMEKRKCDSVVIFSPESIFYMTGMALYPTERPIVLIIRCDGRIQALLPALEAEYAQTLTDVVDDFYSYHDYPGDKHPMYYLKELLDTYAAAKGKCRIVADMNGYSNYYGYKGPLLSEITDKQELSIDSGIITELMAVKSQFDVRMIEESIKWGCRAHELLQLYASEGELDSDVEDRASLESTDEMMKALGSDFVHRGFIPTSTTAYFRGQIGKRSYYPHIEERGIRLKTGDTVISGAWADILGYNSELERVMFVGEPSKESLKYYAHVCEAQSIAFSMIKPGRTCADVDREVEKYFNQEGLMPYKRHHTGHGLGFAVHEAPFLDIGDNTVLKPGMVFSLEPGIYVKNIGGFRISDTVLVTEEGGRFLTSYPKEVDKLICGRRNE